MPVEPRGNPWTTALRRSGNLMNSTARSALFGGAATKINRRVMARMKEVEMISHHALWTINWLLTAATIGYAGGAVFTKYMVGKNAIADRHVPDAEPKDSNTYSLKDAACRSRLSSSLRGSGIYGEADIRYGRVYEPVPPHMISPLASMLTNAAAQIIQFDNSSQSILYLVDPKTGQMRMSGLDLEVILDTSRVIQRVAEDRKQTRSLYKGLSDQEMADIAKSVVSEHTKNSAVDEDCMEEDEVEHCCIKALEKAAQK